jgi:hypothetical protein
MSEPPLDDDGQFRASTVSLMGNDNNEMESVDITPALVPAVSALDAVVTDVSLLIVSTRVKRKKEKRQKEKRGTTCESA